MVLECNAPLEGDVSSLGVVGEWDGAPLLLWKPVSGGVYTCARGTAVV